MRDWRGNSADIERLHAINIKLVAVLERLVAGIDRTECTCSDAYKARGLIDTSCPRCHLDVSDEDRDKAEELLKEAKEST